MAAALPPIIKSAACTAVMPQPAFYLTWDGQGDTGAFTIAVVDQVTRESVAGTGDATAGGGSWTAAAGAMTASGLYEAQVTSAASGLTSTVSLLFNPITDIVTTFEGGPVLLNWTPPVGQPPGQALIFFTAGSFRQVAASEGATGATFLPDPAQTPKDAAWSVSITPTLGVASGPASASATVLNVGPALAILDLDSHDKTSAKGSAYVPSAGLPAQAWFVLTLWQDGVAAVTTAPIAGQAGSNSGLDFFKLPYSFGKPATPLKTSFNYRVTAAQALQTAGGVSRGPDGMGLAMFPWRAVMTEVETNIGTTAADRTVAIAAEPPVGTPAFSGIIGAVKGDGETTTYAWSGQTLVATVKLTAPTIGAAIKASCAPFSGSSRGPYEDFGPSVLTSQPVLESVEYDGATASVTWTAIQDPGAEGYRLQLVDGGGRLVAEAPSPDASGGLAAPAAALSVQVRQAGDRSLGPASAPAALITGRPANLVANWPALGGDASLSWDAVEGAGGYEITVVYGARQEINLTATAGASPSVGLQRGDMRGVASFRVRATSPKDSTPTVAGPWSAPALIIADTPQDVVVRYDGARLRANWTAVSGASSYQVCVLEEGAILGSPHVVGVTDIELPRPYEAQANWSLVVQAANVGSKGPPCGRVPVFSPGWFLSGNPDNAPSLQPADSQALDSFDIVLMLPQIFAGPDPVLPTTPPFVMATATTPYAYSLTIPATSIAWTFDSSPIREALRTAYLAFLTALEGQTATPEGIATVQQAIGRAMPQTFAETLFYNYGLRAEQAYVDLRPGMTLRAEYETYQFLGGAVPDQAYLNGYVASASAEYAVGSYTGSGSWLIGFDRFLASITAGGGLTVPTPTVSQRKMQGAGGVIDTLYQQFRRPFVRLVYPPTFQSQSTMGAASPEYNAVLVAASKLGDLQAATDNIRNGLAAGADAALLYFRGRTTLTAGVKVWLDGQPTPVPLGTTVGNLLEARGARPPAIDLPITGLTLLRPEGAAITGTPAGPAAYAVDGGRPVRLDWVPGAKAAWLGLPLLHGDRLTLG
jgi:hypothetical protein